MKFRALIVLTLLATLCFLTDVFAAEYFVSSTNGSDSNPGTSSAPWKTISKANSKLVAGDTVYIRAGTYSEQIKPINNGSSGKNITYAAAYTGSSRESVTITYSQSAQAYLYNKSYIVIDGLNFMNANGPWIDMTYGTYTTISNCTFTHARNYSGIRMRYSSYCKILSNTFTAGSGGDATFGGYPSDMLSVYNAHHNLIERNTFDKSAHYSINIHYGGASFNIVRNNVFNNEWHAAIGVYETNVGDRNLIENNIIKNSGSDCLNNPDADESCLPTSRFKSYDQHSIQIGVNTHYNIVRKNVMHNNGSFHIQSSSSGTCMHNKIYNNTFDQDEQAIRFPASTTSLEFSNNVFTNNAISRSTNRGMFIYIDSSNRRRDIQLFSNNNWYSNSTSWYKGTTSNDTLSQFISSYPSEFSGNISKDPKFTDWNTQNYTLRPDSPLINAGTWLTTITSPSGSGTSFKVADATYFCDGWGIVPGDQIQLKGSTSTIQIKSIDVSTNTITVSSTINWTNGAGVSLPYTGNGPDIGAYEYTGQVTRLAAPCALSIENHTD